MKMTINISLARDAIFECDNGHRGLYEEGSVGLCECGAGYKTATMTGLLSHEGTTTGISTVRFDIDLKE